MTRKLLLIAALSGFSAVSIGAFGAHAWKMILIENEGLDIFKTASQYHFYHSLAILIIVFLSHKMPSKYLQYALYAFGLGILLFSGSLYLMALLKWSFLGPITPIGGLLLLAGWFLIAITALKTKFSEI